MSDYPEFSDYQDLSPEDLNLDFDDEGVPKPQNFNRSTAFTVKLPYSDFLYNGEKSFKVKLQTGETVSFPKSQAMYDEERKLVLASAWIVGKKLKDGEMRSTF